MVSLPFGLKLKNSLNSHFTFHNIVIEISDILKNIHAIEDLKADPELLLLICNLIENTLIKNKWKIDKKELAVSIHENIFNTTDEEKVGIRAQIQFFHDNGKIKRKKWYKLLVVYAIDWIKRKLG